MSTRAPALRPVTQLRPGTTTRSKRPPRRLHAVKRRSRKLIKRGTSTRFAPAVILIAICVAAAVFFVLLEQVVLAQSAFKLARIRKQLTAVETRHEELVLEAATLESPARIEKYAREVLGMIDPPSFEYIVADVRPHSDGWVAAKPRASLAPTQQAAATGSLEQGP